MQGLSPHCTGSEAKSIEDAWRRGGVPVFRRPSSNLRLRRVPDRPCENHERVIPRENVVKAHKASCITKPSSWRLLIAQVDNCREKRSCKA